MCVVVLIQYQLVMVHPLSYNKHSLSHGDYLEMSEGCENCSVL